MGWTQYSLCFGRVDALGVIGFSLECTPGQLVGSRDRRAAARNGSFGGAHPFFSLHGNDLGRVCNLPVGD